MKLWKREGLYAAVRAFAKDPAPVATRYAKNADVALSTLQRYVKLYEEHGDDQLRWALMVHIKDGEQQPPPIWKLSKTNPNPLPKVYVVSWSTAAQYDSEREENHTRDQDFLDFCCPQAPGIYTTAAGALGSGLRGAIAEYTELYEPAEKDEAEELATNLKAMEWVGVKSGKDGYVESPFDPRCPVTRDAGNPEWARPYYAAMAIIRNPTNREEWNHEMCVVVQEVQLDRSYY